MKRSEGNEQKDMDVSNRNLLIDRLKGFAILLVVLGHSIQFGTYEGLTTGGAIFSFIYSFHMPLFMFLSGYVAKPDGTLGYVKNKFFRLVVPFESYVCLVCIKEFIRSGSIVVLIKQFFYLQIFPNNGGLWFVYVLFFLHIILNLLVRFGIADNKGMGCVIAISMILSLFYDSWYWFGLKYIILYLVFFLCGGLSRKRNYLSETNDSNKGYVIVVIEMIILLTWRFEDAPLFMGMLGIYSGSAFMKAITIVYSYFVPFVGIDFSKRVIIIVSKIEVMQKVLERLGELTLQIYFIHGLFIVELAYLIKVLVVVPEIFLVMILFISTLVITMVIIGLFNRNSFARKLFFGEKCT